MITTLIKSLSSILSLQQICSTCLSKTYTGQDVVRFGSSFGVSTKVLWNKTILRSPLLGLNSLLTSSYGLVKEYTVRKGLKILSRSNSYQQKVDSSWVNHRYVYSLLYDRLFQTEGTIQTEDETNLLQVVCLRLHRLIPPDNKGSSTSYLPTK